MIECRKISFRIVGQSQLYSGYNPLQSQNHHLPFWEETVLRDVMNSMHSNVWIRDFTAFDQNSVTILLLEVYISRVNAGTQMLVYYPIDTIIESKPLQLFAPKFNYFEWELAA